MTPHKHSIEDNVGCGGYIIFRANFETVTKVRYFWIWEFYLWIMASVQGDRWKKMPRKWRLVANTIWVETLLCMTCRSLKWYILFHINNSITNLNIANYQYNHFNIHRLRGRDVKILPRHVVLHEISVLNAFICVIMDHICIKSRTFLLKIPYLPNCHYHRKKNVIGYHQ